MDRELTMYKTYLAYTHPLLLWLCSRFPRWHYKRFKNQFQVRRLFAESCLCLWIERYRLRAIPLLWSWHGTPRFLFLQLELIQKKKVETSGKEINHFVKNCVHCLTYSKKCFFWVWDTISRLLLFMGCLSSILKVFFWGF